MKKETSTVQIGLRLEKDLLERIESLAEDEGVDKMAWIRRALANFVQDEEDGMADAAIEDYLNLRIDEKELLNYVEFKKIPKDIQDARSLLLKSMITKKQTR